ncbi:unnamed protein product, partial [Polarella glacialis]
SDSHPAAATQPSCLRLGRDRTWLGSVAWGRAAEPSSRTPSPSSMPCMGRLPKGKLREADQYDDLEQDDLDQDRTSTPRRWEPAPRGRTAVPGAGPFVRMNAITTIPANHDLSAHVAMAQHRVDQEERQSEQASAPRTLTRPPGVFFCAPCTRPPWADVTDEENVDGLGQAAASRGSIGHPFTCAEACKYAKKSRVCKDGAVCDHCHLCDWKRNGKKNSGV